jgi:hypothetical protein
MFVREHQNQFRGAQADVQAFYGARGSVNSRFSWNKPVGTTFVYMMLIGGGGSGTAGTTGGGTGSVSVWFGAAKNIPSSLEVLFIGSNRITYINAITSSGIQTFLSTPGSSGAGAASAALANGYWASGFYNLTAGEAGSTGTPTPSSITFLSPGGVSTAGNNTANYGYGAGSNGAGYFLLSPIIVSVAESTNAGTVGAYGSGNNYLSTVGTPGAAIIASW